MPKTAESLCLSTQKGMEFTAALDNSVDASRAYRRVQSLLALAFVLRLAPPLL